MKGRLIIDTHYRQQAIYVYLTDFHSEDIHDTIAVGKVDELVHVDVDKDGRVLGVEIILPKDKQSDS